MSLQIQIGADVSGIDQAIDQATKSINKIKPAVANGANALNALSQVARDAPFGFIAIQNNLPILFDQFGNLTKASGGLTGAFKAIGASLAGPAGVTFALGAVISLLTVVTQKYGSIGGAIDAFVGKTISAKDIQDKFNASLEDTKKASAGEIANLNSLIGVLTNVKSSRDQQVGAFDELNKKYPALLTNIKVENVRNAESIALLAKRTQLYKDQIVLEGRREALIKLIGESALEGEKALSKLTTKPDFFSLQELGLYLRGILEGTNPVIARTQVLTKDFSNASKSGESYANSLNVVNSSLTAVEGELKTITETFKKQEEEVKKSINTSKSYKKEQEKLLNLKLEQQRVDNLYNVKKKINEQANLNKVELDGIRDVIKQRRKGEREAGITTPTQIPTIAPSLNNADLILKSKQSVNELDRLKKAADLTAAYNLISSTFFSPLENLFTNFIETGKFAFKEFGQAVLKAINQIVAKVIATGIITLLASIFIPGFAAAGGGVGASLLSGITGALGFGGGGFGGGGRSRVQDPSFGGVSGGGLQMAGAVNLQLRGSDLVGAINRTNATINRVG
jgi:hypothetical protein